MMTVKRVPGHTIRVGGEQPSGWLPEGAAVPLPTPVRDVTFDIEILFDGSGYLLCYASIDGEMFNDTWHKTLGDAEEAAREMFGVGAEQWQDCG